ncbi:MAG TPA: TonB-dependent receptor [Vicinamibacteria bacterium]|nr:TonB-dependent receptor [Vicinamibacteria bacterium]
MNHKRIALAALCCLVAANFLAAQTTGSIDGKVTDDTGAVLPGATVTLTSEALLGGSRTAVTNNLGSYRFPSLSIGIYSVQAELQGFETIRIDNVDVSLGQTSTVDFVLGVASVTETVTVVGESPIVDVRNAGTGTSFKTELLEEVPTRRFMADLMQVSPGMTADVGDGGSSRVIAFGSNRQSNSWNVDGINVTAPETGSAWLDVNVDNIEEIQVYGVGAPAEYGSHSGAVLNVVTKKGGNFFRGGASYFGQWDALTDNNVLADTDSGQKCEAESPTCTGFFRDVYREVNGRIGGPISADKTWFYASAQHYRSNTFDPGTVVSTEGDTPGKSDRFDFKVTSKFGQNHELSALAHWEDWGSGVSPDPFYTQSANVEEKGRNPAWGATWTTIVSDTTLLELKYAGWWSDDIYESATGSFEEPFIDYTPPGGGPTRYSGGLWYPWDYKTWRQQFNAKVTTYAEDFLNSQHDIRFGVQFSRGSAFTNRGIGPNGTYAYNYYDYTYRAYQDPFQYGGESRDLGFFIDDTVTVNDRVTLNLGVRADFNKGWIPDYERLTVGTPSIAQALNAITTGETVPGIDNIVDWKLISPRFGITLQPTDSGRSVVRGSFGVYYEGNTIGNWDFPPPGVPTVEYFVRPPGATDFEFAFDDATEEVGFDPDLTAPRTLQYSAGFEQQIGTDMSIEVQYVHKDTQDLVGWEILDGVYENFPYTDYFGNTYNLLNYIVDPVVRKGNDPGNFPGAGDYEQTYDGVVLAFTKRFGNLWGLNASYTYSKSEGLIPRMQSQAQFNPFYGSREGADPNNHINGYGRLQGDRPHMFRTQGVFLFPGDVNFSASLNLETGRAITRQSRLRLNQGLTTIILQPGGVNRFPDVHNLDLTLGKRFRFGNGDAALRLDGTIYNVFNSGTPLSYSTLRLQTLEEDFTEVSWFDPRRLMVRVGFEF